MRISVLPVMSVLTVIAGAVGLQMGESAISQIDPLYFQGPAPTAMAMTRTGQPAPTPAYADAAGYAEGYTARAADCPDCGVAPAMTGREALPDISAALPSPRTERPTADLAAAEQPFERSAASQRVRRYVDYPVNLDQAETRAAFESADAVPEAR